MDVDAFAARLIAARRTGERIATLSQAEAPASAAEAYNVQDAILRRLGVGIAGWKVGATSPTAEPQGGPIPANRIQASPARFALLPSALRTVEAELAFRLGRDLPLRATPYSEAEAWDAVESLHVAIEVLESSFADRRFVPEHAPLADLLNNGGLCHGPAIHDWRGIDVARPSAVLIIDGTEIRRASAGTPGGHPRRLLAWLANHASKRGHPLKRGDIVTTGSHTGMVDSPSGARVTARFEELGDASLRFAA